MNLYNLKRKIMLYICEKLPIRFLIQFSYFLYNFIPCLVKELEFNFSCLSSDALLVLKLFFTSMIHVIERYCLLSCTPI